MADDLPAALAEIRERRGKAVAREGDSAEWLGAAFRLADEDVPRLLAVADKVLELADRWQESRRRLYERAEQLGDPRMTTDILAEARQLEWCTEALRSAVLSALTGKGGTDAG